MITSPVCSPLQVRRTSAVGQRKRRTPEEFRELCKSAQRIAVRHNPNVALPANCIDLPTLDLSEISFGKVLGRGAFGAVYAVRSLEGGAPSSPKTNGYGDSKLEEDTTEEPYALKVLSAMAAGTDDDFCNAIIDNAKEARVLGSLNHPHIIKLRAMPACGMFSEKSFLLLDRLNGTLKDRLVEWKRELKHSKGFTGNVLGGKAKSAAVWEERVRYMVNLADAVEYLHSLRIIHRDIKSGNVGFNLDDEIQLFDFGMARQLPLEHSDNGLFKMTGYYGSPLYMAPEVALQQEYNEKCDVYSFAILCWEVLALQRPLDGATLEFLEENVWQGEKKRPRLDPNWSEELNSLLSLAWSPNIAERPHMSDISLQMRKENILHGQKEK
eukprot:Nitzschia sp. Nitz4//scaffold293_size23253//8069//9299//NITZ4_008504-RA/size23253-augustus-gene-0.2-mRNA-1//1//CDS//3329546192//8403//frame0